MTATTRLRNIYICNSSWNTPNRVGIIDGNIYADGNDVYIDYGVKNYETDASSINSTYTVGSCTIIAVKDTNSGNQKITVLSGHWVRVSLERESIQVVENITCNYLIGGNAKIDILCAGTTSDDCIGNTSNIIIRDNAQITGAYGGHHGYNCNNVYEGNTTIDIEGNANITELFATGGGRFRDSSPIFKGTSTVNISSGTVGTIYGGPAAGRVQKKDATTDSEININIKGGNIGNVYAGGYGYTYDPTYPLTYVAFASAKLTVGTSVITFASIVLYIPLIPM